MRVAGFFYIEQTRAMRVAGCLNHLQLMMAKTDDVILLQERSYRWLVVANLQTKESGSLLGQMLYQLLVVSADFYLQTILLKEVGIAKVMIQMTMGSQQVNRLQLFCRHSPHSSSPAADSLQNALC